MVLHWATAPHLATCICRLSTVWVISLHFLLHLPLSLPRVTLFPLFLHWAYIVVQIFDYLHTSSPPVSFCQSVQQPACSVTRLNQSSNAANIYPVFNIHPTARCFGDSFGYFFNFFTTQQHPSCACHTFLFCANALSVFFVRCFVTCAWLPLLKLAFFSKCFVSLCSRFFTIDYFSFYSGCSPLPMKSFPWCPFDSVLA